MSITSILDLRFKPESTADALAQLGKTLVDTRAFSGCLGVDVLVDNQDPAHVVLVESWASESDDDAYRAWRAGDGKTDLGSLMAGAPTLTKFSAAGI